MQWEGKWLLKYSYSVQGTVILLRNVQFLKTPFRAWNTSSLRKQETFWDATTGFPAKWCLRNTRKIPYWWRVNRQIWVVLAASDWLTQISPAARPIGSTSQLRVVTCHQYEFLRSFLRRNFEGKPMVASCFSGCKTPWKISFSTYSWKLPEFHCWGG